MLSKVITFPFFWVLIFLQKTHLHLLNTRVILSMFQIHNSLKPDGTGEPFVLVVLNPRGESFLR